MFDDSDSFSEISANDLDPIIFYVSTCDESFIESDLDITDFLKEQNLNEAEQALTEKTGRVYYMYQCKKLNVVPCNYYLRNIENDKINLNHYGLKVDDVKALANSLIFNKTVVELNLSDNYFDDLHIPPLMDMIKLNEMIVHLDLSFNRLTHNCTQILSETLSNSPILKRLNLSNNLFDDKSAIDFGELMILSLRLEYLNLSKNQFAKGCLVPFGKAFLQTTSILHLDLSFNSITGPSSDVNKFANGLTKNKCFKIVDLSFNGFSHQDFMFAFGKMLKTNMVLEELNLSCNHINTEAVVKLAKQLGACKALKILRIGRNPILSAGCYAIVNFCLQNPEPPFKMLDFESCEVNSDFVNLSQRLLESIPDILIITGIKMVDRIFPTVDPIYRLKLLAIKYEIRIFDFFLQFREDDDPNIIKLDRIPEIIDQFCEDNQFQLLEFDRKRIYKTFSRNEERTVTLAEIAKVFDEVYEENQEEAVEEVVKETKPEIPEDPLMLMDD